MRIPPNLYVDEIRGAVSNMHYHARPLYELPQCVESKGDTHSMGMALGDTLYIPECTLVMQEFIIYRV